MRRIGLGNPLKTVSNYSGTTVNGDHHSVPSDEEMRQLEELSKREGLTVEQIVRLSINDFIDHPDDSFRAAARRVMEKNAELYRRLS